MESSRKKNSAKNLAFSFVSYVLYTLISFALRAVFIKTLGEVYLGISGLFTNVLTLLSFAELGVGQAIAFHLYKPLAEDDSGKIASLMLLYKRAYRIIGVVVLAAGLAVIPFFDFVISKKPDITENLVVIYLFYLFNTGLSYFLSYKQTIIGASQREYIISGYGLFFKFLRTLLQAAVLLVFKSFYGYLAVQLVLTLVQNFILSKKADRLFPFLAEKGAKPLEKAEKKEIFSGIRALLFYKIGNSVMNGTDNIIITRLIGLEAVGFSDNYSMIITAISAVVDQIPKAVTASVGNLNATASREKKYSVFKTMVFVCAWIYGFCACGVFVFGSPFVELLFGEKWRLDAVTVFAIVSAFYVSSVHSCEITYRMTSGAFVHGRYVAVLSAVMNIGLSILLGKLIGLSGVFFATTITRLLSYGIIDTVVVYKYVFERKPWEYGAMCAYYLLAAVASCAAGNALVGFVGLSGVLGFATKLLIFSVVFNAVYLLFVFRTPQFREVRDIVVAFLKKALSKFKTRKG